MRRRYLDLGVEVNINDNDNEANDDKANDDKVNDDKANDDDKVIKNNDKTAFFIINYYLFIYQFTFSNKIKIDINIYIDLYQ